MPLAPRFTALLAAAVLVGCTGPAPEPVPEPSTPASSDSPKSPPPPGEPDEPAATEPLVLAVHATRPVRPLPAGAARRLLRDGAGRWSAIAQGTGLMQVVTGGLPEQVAPGPPTRAAPPPLCGGSGTGPTSSPWCPRQRSTPGCAC